jgi:hypothetical protein
METAGRHLRASCQKMEGGVYLTIRGRRWRFCRRRITKEDGRCQHPDIVGKEITVAAHLQGEEELNTTLHELLHAAFWDLDEEAIEQAGTDLARALWRLGYRRDGND